MKDSLVARMLRKQGLLGDKKDRKSVEDAVMLLLSCGPVDHDKLLGMFANALRGIPGVLRMLKTVVDKHTAMGVFKNLQQLSNIILDLKMENVPEDKIVKVLIDHNKWKGGNVGESSASGADSGDGRGQEPSSDTDKAPVHG